jgi:hypothetical protein
MLNNIDLTIANIKVQQCQFIRLYPTRLHSKPNKL